MASITKNIRHFLSSFMLTGTEVEKTTAEDGDREEWDRIWRNRSHRRIETPVRIDVEIGSYFGKVVSVTISEDPPEFSDRVFRKDDLCPVCDQTTIGATRRAAHIYPTFETGFSCGIGVWVHAKCFERCPDAGEPAPIPW